MTELGDEPIWCFPWGLFFFFLGAISKAERVDGVAKSGGLFSTLTG